MNGQRSTKNWVLLSAYVDGELTAREKKKFEQQLHAHPELQAQIDSLKQTRAMIRSLPRKHAPRSFALTPDMVAAKHPARLLPLFTWASAASAVVALVLLFIQFFPGTFTARQSVSMAPEVQMEAAAADAANAAGTPEIIFWGGPPSTVVEGKGGGAPDVPAPLAEIQPAQEIPPAEAEAQKQGEATAAPEALAQESTAPAAETGLASPPDQSQNPILGVRPNEEAGVITFDETTPRIAAEPKPLWPVGVAFLSFALAAGLTAYLLWRRAR